MATKYERVFWNYFPVLDLDQVRPSQVVRLLAERYEERYHPEGKSSPRANVLNELRALKAETEAQFDIRARGTAATNQRLQRAMRGLQVSGDATERDWLFQAAAPPLAEWVQDHRSQLRLVWALDGVLALDRFFQRRDDGLPGYREEDVHSLRPVDEAGPFPPTSSTSEDEARLWHEWQRYAGAATPFEQQGNSPKFSLHWYSAPHDDAHGLRVEFKKTDWFRVQSLNLALRDGLLPDRYSRDLIPEEVVNGYAFRSRIPNLAGTYNLLITADDYLIVCRRSGTVAFHPYRWSATFEEQMSLVASDESPADESPFDTFRRAVEKEEFHYLRIAPGSARLVAILLEPLFSGTAFVVAGRVQSRHTDIGRHNLRGREHLDIATYALDLDGPLIADFFDPDFAWHAASRLRIIAALCYVHPYESVLSRLNDEFRRRHTRGRRR